MESALTLKSSGEKSASVLTNVQVTPSNVLWDLLIRSRHVLHALPLLEAILSAGRGRSTEADLPGRDEAPAGA
jgi:hypothetical protein